MKKNIHNNKVCRHEFSWRLDCEENESTRIMREREKAFTQL